MKVFHLIADTVNGVQMIRDIDLFVDNPNCNQLRMQDFYESLCSCDEGELLVSEAIDLSNQAIVEKIKAEYGIN